MDVKLIVASGKSAGQAIPIAGSKFFVGRAEDCHLRPRSDLVSRHHCALIVEDSRVSIRDFGSKNGTLVNGQRVHAEQELKNGDQLTIGNLEFKIELSVDVGGKKKPKVKSVEEAAQRTVESAQDDDLDIAELLGEDDAGLAAPDMDTRTLASIIGDGDPNETVQAPQKDPEPDAQVGSGEVASEAEKEAKRKEQDIVGVSEASKKRRTAATSQEAAAAALKNFFKGRQ